MNNLLQYYFLNLKYLNLVSFSVKKVIHFYSLKHDLTKFFNVISSSYCFLHIIFVIRNVDIRYHLSIFSSF